MADIHPETAARYGIADKAWMTIESPRGAIRAKARVTDSIGPGVVRCQHGWWQECKNLESPGYDASAEGRPIRVCLSAQTSPIRSAARCRVARSCAL